MEYSELWKGVKHRIKNPFYSAWIIAFVLWNWRGILVIIFPSSDVSLVDRFIQLDDVLYSNVIKHICYIYLLPIATAFIATRYVPGWLNKLDRYWYQAIIDRSNDRKERDVNIHLTYRDRENLLETIRDSDKKIEEGEFKIKRLEAQLQDAGNQNMTLRHSQNRGDMLMPAESALFFEEVIAKNDKLRDAMIDYDRMTDDERLAHPLIALLSNSGLFAKIAIVPHPRAPKIRRTPFGEAVWELMKTRI